MNEIKMKLQEALKMMDDKIKTLRDHQKVHVIENGIGNTEYQEGYYIIQNKIKILEESQDELDSLIYEFDKNIKEAYGK